ARRNTVATIKLTNIRKSFGDVDIIKGVSLGIDDREFVVFVGPSGCGKSTLLRLIAGLEEISDGDLFIDGVRSNDVPPAKRGLAMVFQSYALYPHMSVADNMAFSLRLAHVSKEEREKKVQEAARVLQLEPLLHRKPKELSGGQRQRVAIGRAIVRNPKVFLFDEPLSNLDASLRVQMRIELTRLHDELQATMIYVTVEPGRVKEGANVTLGVRPEHFRVSDRGLIRGEVLVVERLGGETFLHVKVTTGELLTVQAEGDSPVRMHDNVGLQANPTDCHPVDPSGLAIPRTTRHPLAGEVRRGSHSAS